MWASVVGELGFDEALAAVQARLGRKGASHCERVAATAGDLAEVYGVDVDSARLAGALHDWDRDIPRSRLVEHARELGLEVTPIDEAVPYLLHARTGAVDVGRHFPGVSADVARAISLHTVGARDMTPLDQVVYLADMLEPGRDFEGVDELRAAVGAAPLPELFALGYRLSVMHLVRVRRRIHPETIEVWNALVAGEPR